MPQCGVRHEFTTFEKVESVTVKEIEHAARLFTF